MGLTESSGTVTTTTSEVTILDSAALNSHGLWLFLDQLVSGDVVTVRTYIKDVQAGTLKKYRTYNYSGAMTDPAVYIAFLPTSEFKVTIQKISGNNYTHNYNHETY